MSFLYLTDTQENISIAAEPNQGSLAYSRLIEMVKVIVSRLQRMAAAYIEQGLH